jgi:hypothetical protein
MDADEEADPMRHHIVYWKMARREADVDAMELAALQEEERRGEIYIEYVDGRRRSLTWDHVAHHWRAATPADHTHAA